MGVYVPWEYMSHGSICPMGVYGPWEYRPMGVYVSWEYQMSFYFYLNLQGSAIMAMTFSKTTLGASTKFCLHFLHEVILVDILHPLQTTCPFRHWISAVPLNRLHAVQVNKATKSSYLKSEAEDPVVRPVRLTVEFELFILLLTSPPLKTFWS